MKKTISNIFKYRLVRYLLYLILGIVLFAVYIPSNDFFGSSLISYAPHISFFLVLLGIVFLISRNERPMYAVLITAFLISFHLKISTNDIINRYPVNDNLNSIKVSLIDLDNYENPNDFKKQLDESEDQIIALQNITPRWNSFISKNHSGSFPYYRHYSGKSSSGLGFVSKSRIYFLDSLAYYGAPAITACIMTEQEDCINILNVKLIPEKLESLSLLYSQLDKLSDYVTNKKDPFICMGNFNMVSWEHSMNRFKKKASLRNSDQSNLPRIFSDNSKSFFSTQHSHILYSEAIHCKSYNESWNNRKGISATFAINKDKYRSQQGNRNFIPMK